MELTSRKLAMYVAYTFLLFHQNIPSVEKLEKEQSRIIIRLEKRKWGKIVTIVTGIMNSKKLSIKLKTLCACGGSGKHNRVLLQGDHKDKVKGFLIEEGYPEERIEVH